MYLCISGFDNNFKDEINFRRQKLQIITSNKINHTTKINFYTSKNRVYIYVYYI